jgi:imidazole glycerol-phosphate synthase subunit HisH
VSESIGVIDYGMGNLRSVQKGFAKVGYEVLVTCDPDRLSDCGGLVLPGVGAFGDAMKQLSKRGLLEPVLRHIESGKQILGICLGMQLFFDYSEEHGRHTGLGVIPGKVSRLTSDVKVPHMGWNVVEQVRESRLLDGVGYGDRFYFVHSYVCVPNNDECRLAVTPYGIDFMCAAGKGNVWGLQFHPEKSSSLGLKILENFGRLVEGVTWS